MPNNALTGKSKSGGSNRLDPQSNSNTAQGGGGGVNVETLDRNVSYYKLTSSDVILLGGLGVLSTLFISLGFAALGFYANIKAGIAFANGPLTPEGQLFNDTFGPLSLWSGIVLVAIGFGLTGVSIFRFNAIKKEHTKGSVAF